MAGVFTMVIAIPFLRLRGGTHPLAAGPVNPGLLHRTGRSDRHAGGCHKNLGPGRQIVSKDSRSGVSRIGGQAGTQATDPTPASPQNRASRAGSTIHSLPAESVLGNIWPMVPSCTHISFNLAQPIGWSRQAMSLASRTRSGIAATRPRTENAITADRRIFHSFSA